MRDQIYTHTAREQLYKLLDLVPDAAEELIKAAKEGRLSFGSTIFLRADPNGRRAVCGCFLGLAGYVAVGMDKAFNKANELREEIAPDRQDWCSELEVCSFMDGDASHDEAVSIIENWQEARLQAQAEDRGRV